MRIYVDFDDCLCETATAFSKLVLEMFNKHVPYDQIHYFELDRSFDLDAEQYERFMLRAYEPDILLSFDATPGATKAINEWISCGHEISIITGRPCISGEIPDRLDRISVTNSDFQRLEVFRWRN